MELEPVIGLEIHVQLKTKSKMFCSCANIFGDVEPNSAICPVCLGYPGTLPVPNRQAIEWAQLTGAALGCGLATSSKFDRKSYFYPDLPKGYQISQYDQPFCGQGKLVISVDGQERQIGITRIHLEEDAAKNTHPKGADYTLVDYNRAGTPLMEIVTEPDMRTPEEARAFLQELQKIVRRLGVSDADMEKGQMRCDANISLREKGSAQLHPKTEVKNINSFKFVEKALQFEIGRQTKAWEKNEIPKHATRGWNSITGKTTEQRTKEEAADYRYFAEPDIPPFVFSAEYLNSISEQLPEMPREIASRLLAEYNLTDQHAKMFATDPNLSHLLEDAASEIKQLDKEQTQISEDELPALIKLAAKIILREVRQIIADQQVGYGAGLKITAANLAELVVLLHRGKMNSNAVAPVLNEMQKTGGDPDHILQNLGLEQVSGEDELLKEVRQVIKENPDAVQKVIGGKEATLQFLMGQVMAKTQGKANPGVVIQLLKKEIL